MTPDLWVNYVPEMMSFENSKIIVMLGNVSNLSHRPSCYISVILIHVQIFLWQDQRKKDSILYQDVFLDTK